jgi:hypothetical protein
MPETASPAPNTTPQSPDSRVCISRLREVPHREHGQAAARQKREGRHQRRGEPRQAADAVAACAAAQLRSSPSPPTTRAPAGEVIASDVAGAPASAERQAHQNAGASRARRRAEGSRRGCVTPAMRPFASSRSALANQQPAREADST